MINLKNVRSNRCFCHSLVLCCALFSLPWFMRGAFAADLGEHYLTEIKLPPRLQPQNPVATSAPALQSSQSLLLTEFVDRVLRYHPKILGADIERRIATAKRLEKAGAFDPTLSIDSDYLRYNSSSSRGNTKEMGSSVASVDLMTRYGIKLSAGGQLSGGDIKSPASSTGDGGTYFLGLKVPLLRGFMMNEKIAAALQADLGEPFADAAYHRARLDIVQDAINQYWDWVAEARKVTVAENLLKLAQERYRVILDRANAGDLPKIDTIEAEQEVQRRQGGLVKAQRDYQKVAYKLSLFLWDANGVTLPQPTISMVPATSQRPGLLSDDDWMEGRAEALQKRPELKTVSIQRDITTVDLDYAKNLRLPVVDLYGAPGSDLGAGGIGQTYKAGVSIIVPLRQRTANGLVSAAKYKIEKLNLDQLMLVQKIMIDVDDAVNAVNTTYERFLAAEKEYELATALELGEREKFALGDSSLFLVNQRERSTAEVAVKVIDIYSQYRQAIGSFSIAKADFTLSTP